MRGKSEAFHPKGRRLRPRPGVVKQIVSVGAGGEERNSRKSGRSKRPDDVRTEAQRDIDRITYATEWRRLGSVTQVISPFDENPDLHNRLTHSEKVAQVARSIGHAVLADSSNHSVLRKLGGFDIHVCEAAALAHDLGHPPFGHTGEELLDVAARQSLGLSDGFEGNAQTFRILTTGNSRSLQYEGLDLTYATLAAVLKYPWARRKPHDDPEEHKRSLKTDPDYRRHWRKFNVYSDHVNFMEEVRSFVRGRISEETQTLEASVMDMADDISYAVHDLEDFIVSGVLSIAPVLRDLALYLKYASGEEIPESFNPFIAAASKLELDYRDYYSREAMIAAVVAVQTQLGKIAGADSITQPQRVARVRELGSNLIGKYISQFEVKQDPLWEHGPHIGLKQAAWHEVQVLKVITKSYIIQRPDLALHQRGLRMVLDGLVHQLRRWLHDKTDRHRLPPWLDERAELIRKRGGCEGELSVNRCILDFICTLGDSQCRTYHQRLSGADVQHLAGLGGL